MNFKIKTIILLLCLHGTYSIAATGQFFNVNTSGTLLTKSVNFTLCLNVQSSIPRSCDDFTTDQARLTITTKVPDLKFRFAGIRVNTPGFHFNGGQGQAPAESFIYLGIISDTEAVTGTIQENVKPALHLSISDLALSVNGLTLDGQSSGLPRKITVTNPSTATATGLTIEYPAWPMGTTASTDCGSTLAGGAQCTITITPGPIPTSNCSEKGIAPLPGILSVRANEVTPVISHVVVLNYGCLYEGGYIFSMTENANTSQSITGKVIAPFDQAARYNNGIIWSSDGGGSAPENSSIDIIPGIDDKSTSTSPSPTYLSAKNNFELVYQNTSSDLSIPNQFPFPSETSFRACNGRTDGACNSENIHALYSTIYDEKKYINTNYDSTCDRSRGGAGGCILTEGTTSHAFYAAGLCKKEMNGKNDWYLPAICEMGPNSNGSGCLNTQNIIRQVPGLIGTRSSSNPDTSCAYGVNCLVGYYWSSTEVSRFPRAAWDQLFDSVTGHMQNSTPKFDKDGVRCARAF